MMRRKGYIWDALKYIILCVGAILVIFPLIFTFISSLKSNTEIFSDPWGFPASPHFISYVSVFVKYRLHTYFLNSVYYSVVVCVVSAAVVTMAAYGIARMKWALSGVTLAFLLMGIMVPLHSIIVPLYVSVSRMGISNRVALMAIFIAGSIPTSVFMVIGFLKGIPREMEESAVIDGCSIPKVFVNIILPMIKPAVATVTIFNFLGVWNDLMLSLVFLNDETQKTLQLGIIRFSGAMSTDYGLLLSSLVVALIPSIAVYLLASQQLINGISAGAVKG